jgi:hypothetical protein
VTETVGFRGGEAGETGAGDMVAALASGSATEDTYWSGAEDVVVVRSLRNGGRERDRGREGGREGGKKREGAGER